MRVIWLAITILLVSAIAENFLPWWIISPISFLVCYLFKSGKGTGFLACFLGIFLLWAGMSFIIDQGNEHILSARIAQLFHLPSYFLVILITGLIGGLVAGMSGLAAAFLVKR